MTQMQLPSTQFENVAHDTVMVWLNLLLINEHGDLLPRRSYG